MVRNRLIGSALLGAFAFGAPGCADDEVAEVLDDAACVPEEMCGEQANCMQTETLMSGLVVQGEGYDAMVHMHDELTGDIDNQWMIMLRDADGNAAPNTKLTATTYSEDCCHGGPVAPEEVTTDDMGMATIEPAFAHGGPWSVRIDVDSDDAEGEQEVIIQLCVPGLSHADMHGGGHDHSAGDDGHDDHSAGDDGHDDHSAGDAGHADAMHDASADHDMHEADAGADHAGDHAGDHEG